MGVFNYQALRSHKLPVMISSSAGPYPEMVRWYLDHLTIPYIEKRHAPMFHQIVLKMTDGGLLMPYVRTTDAQLCNGKSVITYYEEKLPDKLKLSLIDPELKTLFDYFNDHLGNYVLQWSYFHLLPLRTVTANILTADAPFYQKLLIKTFYPLNAWMMRKVLHITPETAALALEEIKKTFDLIAVKLADGRPFLNGDKISIADIGLAGLMGPVILPKEYGGYLCDINDTPTEMHEEIDKLRAHPTGTFILKLYKEHRPASMDQSKKVKRHTYFHRLKKSIATVFLGKGIQRTIFSVLRRVKPILVFRKHVFITSHEGVQEGLSNDTLFTIKEINAANMEELQFPFILGMDSSPQYDREKEMIRSISRREDLHRIRSLVIDERDRLLQSQLQYGKLDIVNSYARIVVTRFSDDYFGLELKNETQYMHWMRILFWQCFLNLSKDAKVKEIAIQASLELKEHLDQLIKKKEQQIINHEAVADTLLTRMVHYKKENSWVDNDTIRRNLCGLMIGTLDNTCKVLVKVIQYFTQHQVRWKEFISLSHEKNDQQLTAFWLEALRFNPHNPILLRHSASQTTFQDKTIPMGSTVYFVHTSAMFDPTVYTTPKAFIKDRGVDYLHFGYGAHRCFGEHITYVQITELLKGLTSFDTLECLHQSDDGPFPDSLVLKTPTTKAKTS